MREKVGRRPGNALIYLIFLFSNALDVQEEKAIKNINWTSSKYSKFMFRLNLSQAYSWTVTPSVTIFFSLRLSRIFFTFSTPTSSKTRQTLCDRRQARSFIVAINLSGKCGEQHQRCKLLWSLHRRLGSDEMKRMAFEEIKKCSRKNYLMILWMIRNKLNSWWMSNVIWIYC